MANPQPIAAVHHLHFKDELCPTCDQPIPHDRADEVARRIEARDKERSAEIATALEERFARERTEADERARLDTEDKVAAARAATLANVRAEVDAATQGRQAAETALKDQDQAFAVEREQQAVANRSLVEKLADAEIASKAEIARVQAEATAREETIRAEAKAAADAEIAERLQALEGDRTAAQEAAQDAQGRLAAAEQRHAHALEDLEQQAEQREAAARREATETVQATLDAAHAAKTEAEGKAEAAAAALKTAEETHASELDTRLTEQREALESAKDAAVNAEKVAAFEANLKLSSRVEELQRLIEKQASDELGEGAEVLLYEALLGEFEGDLITRVGRGSAGADIMHTVMHNGRECGKIIYDSKDHGAWRGDFITKLKADQMAAKAEHAVLSCRKFPAGARQLHNQDGVIVANPARVVALVTMLRSHLISMHTLRLSGEARHQKTAQLYEYITSERSRELFDRFDTYAQDLGELQEKEKRAHDLHWRKEGELHRSISRVKTDIVLEIDSIIGGSEFTEQLP